MNPTLMVSTQGPVCREGAALSLWGLGVDSTQGEAECEGPTPLHPQTWMPPTARCTRATSRWTRWTIWTWTATTPWTYLTAMACGPRTPPQTTCWPRLLALHALSLGSAEPQLCAGFLSRVLWGPRRVLGCHLGTLLRVGDLALLEWPECRGHRWAPQP